MMKNLFMGVLMAMLLFSTTLVRAETLTFTVHNTTGYTIFFVYISHVSEGSWGKDLLGEDVIMPGARRTFEICNKNYSTPVYDIRFVDEDLDTYTFTNGNIKQYPFVRLRLDHMD